MAAKAENTGGATLEEPAIPSDHQVQQLRRPWKESTGDAVGEEAGVRKQPRVRRGRGEPRPSSTGTADRRLVSLVPDSHPRHPYRGLPMMAEGKMGPRGGGTRSKAEPPSQRRERVCRENYLLIESIHSYFRPFDQFPSVSSIPPFVLLQKRNISLFPPIILF